jgi:hypothetical protein
MGSGPDTTLGPRVFGADYFSNIVYPDRGPNLDMESSSLIYNKKLHWKRIWKSMGEDPSDLSKETKESGRVSNSRGPWWLMEHAH